ncbi:hypothetical protein D9M70_524360 [compost metagenome]
MQIGVENLAFAELHPFGGLWLLDLDDHVRFFEHFLCRRDNLRASGTVRIVIRADPCPGLGFHDHLVAMGNIFTHRAGRQADSIFMVFDFLRATDTHPRVPLLLWAFRHF